MFVITLYVQEDCQSSQRCCVQMTKLAEWCVGLGSAATTWYLFYAFALLSPRLARN